MLFGFAGSISATTYRLQRVTSVEAGKKYVFEQAGYVMSNSINKKNELETVSSFNITGLTGGESYVWERLSDNRLKNVTGSSYYLYYSSDLKFGTSGTTNAYKWAFSFQPDGTAHISNLSNGRYLAYTKNTAREYKSYTDDYFAVYPHSIVVYKLVEEVKSSPNLAFSSRMISVLTGEDIDEPVLTSVGVSVSYTSSNTKVATVNSETGEVTVVGPGRTLITASSEATEDYDAGEATYTLLVMDGDGTESNPYSIADFSTGYMPSVPVNSKYFIQGYIVGYYNSSSSFSTTPEDDVNIALSSDRDGAMEDNSIAVELNDYSSSFGLVAHPENMGKRVNLYGRIDANTIYRGKIGVDEVASMSFADHYPVTISNYKYATYRTTEKLNFTGTGVSAYTAAIDGSKVKLTKISDGIVNSGLGVVLYSGTAGTYDIPVTTAEATVSSTGLSISDGTSATKEAKTYVLGKKDDGNGNEIVGFYRWIGAQSLPAGRVYLNGGASAARDYLEFMFDEPTDIGNVSVNYNDNHYYDLQGRRVAHGQQPTAKGLYIVNGKKIVIK